MPCRRALPSSTTSGTTPNRSHPLVTDKADQLGRMPNLTTHEMERLPVEALDVSGIVRDTGDRERNLGWTV